VLSRRTRRRRMHTDAADTLPPLERTLDPSERHQGAMAQWGDDPDVSALVADVGGHVAGLGMARIERLSPNGLFPQVPRAQCGGARGARPPSSPGSATTAAITSQGYRWPTSIRISAMRATWRETRGFSASAQPPESRSQASA
jgi:hypothetical protein